MSRLAVTMLLVLGVIGGTNSVRAQASPEKPDVEKRLELLERKLEQLEKRVDAALATSTAPAATDDRLEALDQKLRVLERNRELEQENLAAKAKETPLVSAGRDGFSITSGDKSYRLKLGGYAQADGRTFYDDRAHNLNDSFSVRRARLNIDATVGKYVDIRVAPEFGNGSVVLFDAYADLKYRRYAVLRGGKFKAPLGLEWLQAVTDLPFIERSLVTDLVPNRDVGFQVYGDVAGYFTYQAAVTNGTNDGTSSDRDTNDGKDVIGRIFATPFAKSGPNLLRGVGFGIGASSGRQNGTTTAPGLPSLKTTGGQATFFSYGSGSGATAVVPFAAGRRVRFSPQLYYYNGPFGLLAEYVESAQQVSAVINKNTVAREITNHAWQVAGSWLLTGEKKSYGRVSPKKRLELGSNGRGFGAWEIAARYTELNVDPTAFIVKFADITKSAEAARTWSAGLNWYLNRNARLSFDYEQTHFQGGALLGNRPTEKAFEQRLQIVF